MNNPTFALVQTRSNEETEVLATHGPARSGSVGEAPPPGWPLKSAMAVAVSTSL